jgi:hypothetical protein
MFVTTDLKKLYESDDYEWLLETIELLKNKQFQQLDLDNLIEELEDLGSEKRNAVESLLEQIIRHILLLEYWTEEYSNNAHHWQGEIVNFRNQLRRRLTKNLRNHLAEERLNLYRDALKYVTIKTKNQVDFPQECPYNLEQLLDENYLP